jgi:uncharacterized protein YbjT (DUF2867 family)
MIPLMTSPVLVTGATGQVDRLVVHRLLDAGVPVRALTRRPDAAILPANVEVVAGDLTVPESLDAALRGARAAFLVWTGRDYVLTGPESLSQAQQVGIIADVLGRPITFEELSPDEFRRETEFSWPRPLVDMLLDAWGATIGMPAYTTSTVFDILGSAPRWFRQWVGDHATAFTEA